MSEDILDLLRPLPQDEEAVEWARRCMDEGWPMNVEWLPYTLGAGLVTVCFLRNRRFVEIRFFGLFRISFGDDPPTAAKN